jgi:hypothetical protein
MGRLVADAGKRDWDELTAEYGAMLMEGLSVMGCKRASNSPARCLFFSSGNTSLPKRGFAQSARH